MELLLTMQENQGKTAASDNITYRETPQKMHFFIHKWHIYSAEVLYLQCGELKERCGELGKLSATANNWKSDCYEGVAERWRVSTKKLISTTAICLV